MMRTQGLDSFVVGSEYTFLVPCADNDGVSFDGPTIAEIERAMVDQANGFTRYPQALGVWADDGKTYTDPVTPYGVATDAEGALSIARLIGARLHQLAVYVRMPDGRSAIVPTSQAGSIKILLMAILGTLAALWLGTDSLTHAHAITGACDALHAVLHAASGKLALSTLALPVFTSGRKRGQPMVSDAVFSAMVTRIVSQVSAASPEDYVAGSLWYQVYGDIVAEYGTPFSLTRAQSCGVFATLSPQQMPHRNWAMFCVALHKGPDHKAVCASGDQQDKIRAILACDGTYSAVAVYCTGPKVSRFYANMAGNVDLPTIDRHAWATAMGRDLAEGQAPSDNDHVVCTAAYQVAASMIGVSPAVCQAIAWVARRTERGIVDPPIATMLGLGQSLDLPIAYRPRLRSAGRQIYCESCARSIRGLTRVDPAHDARCYACGNAVRA